jgi:hypothetical protein
MPCRYLMKRTFTLMRQGRFVIPLLDKGIEIDIIKNEDVSYIMTISSWNKTNYVWP